MSSIVVDNIGRLITNDAHLDIVAEEFGRTYNPTVALWGDVREGVRDLMAALAGDALKLKAARADYAAEVAAKMAEWREGVKERLTSAETPINIARMIHELNQLMPEDGLLLADYKTDRLTAQTLQSRVEFYRPQVDTYRSMIEAIAGVPVVEASLVFLVPRRSVEIPRDA